MTGRIIRRSYRSILVALLTAAATVWAQLPANLDDDYISENKSKTLHGESARSGTDISVKKPDLTTPAVGVPDAISALDTETLMQKAGQIVTVEGVIVATGYSQKSDTRFFNFDKKRQKFSFVMFSSAAEKFKDLGEPREYFLDKKVQVTGVLTLYKGKPSMAVSKPDQIVIVR
jgi:hypothetical protein